MRKTANNDFEILAPVEREALPALSCMRHKTKRGVMSRHHPKLRPFSVLTRRGDLRRKAGSKRVFHIRHHSGQPISYTNL